MSEIKTVFHENRDGSMTFERKQDIGDILADNKELYKGGDSQPEDLSMGRRVASIPLVVVEQWMKEGINIFDMGHDPDVKREVHKRLNSVDYRHLRTHNSRL
tara:strand:- start:31060 stop:31365 length:306 start_codon:yes stop_codon:yes gene_type:complete